MKARLGGGYRYSCTLCLTSALDEEGGQHPAPAALPPGKSEFVYPWQNIFDIDDTDHPVSETSLVTTNQDGTRIT